MLIPTSVGSRIKLSAKNCNLTFQDSTVIHPLSSSPLGRHSLRLSDPYQRALACVFLDVAANHRYDVVFFVPISFQHCNPY